MQKLLKQTVPLFQIIAVNKGHISGTLVYRGKPSDFGGMIDVTPPSIKLQPDEHKSFNLSFSSNRKGDFVERVDFVVKESLEVLSLHIKYVARSMNRWNRSEDDLLFDDTPLLCLTGDASYARLCTLTRRASILARRPLVCLAR